MIEWKRQLLNILVSSIEEAVASEAVSFIHVLGSFDGLDHWSDDDVGINDCEVKDGHLGCKEVPCSFSANFLDALYPRTGDCVFTASSTVT